MELLMFLRTKEKEFFSILKTQVMKLSQIAMDIRR